MDKARLDDKIPQIKIKPNHNNTPSAIFFFSSVELAWNPLFPSCYFAKNTTKMMMIVQVNADSLLTCDSVHMILCTFSERNVKYKRKINGAKRVGGGRRGSAEEKMPWIKCYIIYAFPFSTTKQ